MNSVRRSCQAGFSLVELLIVMVIVGILAGIALPSLQEAVWRARAAEVVSDIHTITLAYHHFQADGGERVRNSGWGRVPRDLEPYLPDGFSFSSEVAQYRWTRVRPRQSPWNLEMGMVRVRPLGEVRRHLMPKLALVAPAATSVVTGSQLRFYITP